MRNNLIDFRKKIGLSQEEFGKLFNLSRLQICNIEIGKRKGSAEMWIDLAILFNLNPKQVKKLMEVF